MKSPVIIDTGPLVALLNARDAFNAWAVETLKTVAGPMITCEAVVSETLFLLRNVDSGTQQIAGMLSGGVLRIAFNLAPEQEKVCRLLTKYADVPMSLADGCLVRMSELHPKHKVMTLDTDFRIYRRHRNRVLSLLTPE